MTKLCDDKTDYKLPDDAPGLEALGVLWDEGIESGQSKTHNFSEIKQEALRRLQQLSANRC